MLGTHPLIRFLNQNRRKIRNIILIIVVFFLVLRTLNYMAQQKLEKEEIQKNEKQEQITIEEEHKELIEKFLDYCINKDVSSAYKMLSSENNYKTQNEFKENYINKYFSETKIYNITLKSSKNDEYIYNVKISKDILSSGKLDNNAINQNFVVVKEDTDYKILIKN